MDRLNFKIFIGIWVFLWSFSSYGARVLILTDQVSKQRAQEIKAVLESTPPFSMLKDFSVVVKYIPKNSLSCQKPLVETYVHEPDAKASAGQYEMPESCREMLQNAGLKNPQTADERSAKAAAQEQIALANRLVTCDTSQSLMELSGQENADRTIFVKESDEWGGEGGVTVTVTTALPAIGAVHELMHTFGFADEYPYYSKCEADTYCPYMKGPASPNVAVFKDENPYKSDQEARTKHASQIPWFSRIKSQTLITTGNQLGTPKAGEIGLYQLEVCDLATEKVKSWRPGDAPTIMEHLGTDYIPKLYWDQIAQALGTEFIDVKESPRAEKSRKGTR